MALDMRHQAMVKRKEGPWNVWCQQGTIMRLTTGMTTMNKFSNLDVGLTKEIRLRFIYTPDRWYAAVQQVSMQKVNESL